MNYAIEELVVDAMAAYLKAKAQGGIKVYAAPYVKPIQYPAVVVRVADFGPIAEGISWSEQQKCTIEVAVISEFSDKIEDPRRAHAAIRASVLNALTVKDDAATPAGLATLCQAQDLPHGLAAELTAMLVPGVWIQLAQPNFPLCTIGEESERRCLVSMITVSVIARGIEIA